MHLYFLRHTYPIKRKKKLILFLFVFALSFLSRWLLFSSHGIISNTQGAISRLFARILLFSHLCLYLLYIVFCVHTLITVISHNYVLCFGIRRLQTSPCTCSLHEICGSICCHFSIFFFPWQSLKREQDILDINTKQSLQNKTNFHVVIWSF